MKTKETSTGNKVYYIDVGDMSPDEAAAYVAAAKTEFENNK